jgi:hypothetical protein
MANLGFTAIDCDHHCHKATDAFLRHIEPGLALATPRPASAS